MTFYNWIFVFNVEMEIVFMHVLLFASVICSLANSALVAEIDALRFNSRYTVNALITPPPPLEVETFNKPMQG